MGTVAIHIMKGKLGDDMAPKEEDSGAETEQETAAAEVADALGLTGDKRQKVIDALVALVNC